MAEPRGRVPRLMRTTAFRLAVLFVLLFAGAAGGLVWYLTDYASRALRAQMIERIENDALTLRAILDAEGLRGLFDAVTDRSRVPGANLYLLATVGGDALVGNVVLYDAAVLATEAWREIEYARDDGSIVTRDALARVWTVPDDLRLLIGRDLEEQTRLRAIMFQAGLWGAGGVVLLGLAAALILSLRVLRRIDALAATSRTIMAGDFTGRLATSGSGDELDRLADAVNAMLERIAQLMNGLEQVSNDIAHDLRTPLARIAARTEAALRDVPSDGAAAAVLAANLEDMRGLMRTFEALLLIARTEAGGGHDSFAPVDVAAIARDVGELYEPAAEDAGLALRVEAPEAAVVAGNRELIARALANMVDNAVKYGAGGTPPEIAIRVGTTADGIAIEVRDRGPGIPAAERGHVLERFVRLDRSRSKPGFGLGLALVAAVARLHDARLDIDDAWPGLIVRLTFREVPR